MMRILFALIFWPMLQYAIGQEEIMLYQGKPKGSEAWNWSEKTSTSNAFNTKVVYNVVEPSITAYLPPYYLATGTAIIVAPGGAFHTLSIDNEGVEVARWLNSKGIAAFVLKYRLVHSMTDDPVAELLQKMSDFDKLDDENAAIIPLAMQDGLTAVGYLREHAREFDINPGKIGFMGFSAGATLTMSVVYNAADEQRPDFVIPVYAYEPAILGTQVPETETPIFLAVAGDDQLGMTLHSVNIYRKWFEAGQPAELHIYEKGGHGFGMRKQNLPTDSWYERLGEWLQLQGYLKRLYPSKYEKLYGEEAVARSAVEKWERLKKDYAELDRYADLNLLVEKVKKTSPRVVFLGNSITEGWVRTDSSFFIRNNFIGRGISGQTSSQLLLRFRQDVVDLSPEAVVIHIGTNDIAENTGIYNPEFTMDNIESMVEIAQTNHIKVILAAVVPSTKFEWNRAVGDRSDMIIDLNRRIERYARSRDIPFVDYHSALKNEENGMDPEVAPDGVHPNAAGYTLMESLILPVVQKCLSD
ncbi:MAG: alpha/beta hydrolase fold domain-containing protein [Saprospiraceae bacterium]|nr:alpha/beta hydrolase fold domain-containing protein [Saprospiraceae bacterium]